jgi:hypothetical protein
VAREYAIIEAPSVLGLRPTGVEWLPDALLKAGLWLSWGAGEKRALDVTSLVALIHSHAARRSWGADDLLPQRIACLMFADLIREEVVDRCDGSRIRRDHPNTRPCRCPLHDVANR